jgi:hypothetical protein
MPDGAIQVGAEDAEERAKVEAVAAQECGMTREEEVKFKREIDEKWQRFSKKTMAEIMEAIEIVQCFIDLQQDATKTQNKLSKVGGAGAGGLQASMMQAMMGGKGFKFG